METYAQVDLTALAHNLAIMRALTGRLILLPVKANAYGHGLAARPGDPGARNQPPASGPASSEPPARTAVLAQYVEQHRLADWFGVASVDEGADLRQAGIASPILKLSPAAPEDLDRAIAAALTLTVADAAAVDQVGRAADRLGCLVDVHLKVDTGMRRIGTEPVQAPEVAALIEARPNLSLTGVFTHLAAADDPAQDDFTTAQLAVFDRAIAATHDRIGRRIGLIHAANSAGVLRFPEAWYDLVRPGIASFGYPPCPPSDRLADREPPDFRSVLSLVSHVSFVKAIRAGETVSYGRTWTAPTDTRLATIPIGYGDGYTRRLSNQAEVLIAGRRYHQVGTICMDQIMVDLGPDSAVLPGQPVTLIGQDGPERIGADDLGRLTGTIPYEILTGLAARVPRVYVS